MSSLKNSTHAKRFTIMHCGKPVALWNKQITLSATYSTIPSATCRSFSITLHHFLAVSYNHPTAELSVQQLQKFFLQNHQLRPNIMNANDKLYHYPFIFSRFLTKKNTILDLSILIIYFFIHNQHEWQLANQQILSYYLFGAWRCLDTKKKNNNLNLSILIVYFFIHNQHEWQLAINKYYFTICSVLDAGSVLSDFW